eukprot:scaffold3762_cov103-Skeletonema_marinoi.AAC.6
MIDRECKESATNHVWCRYRNQGSSIAQTCNRYCYLQISTREAEAWRGPLLAPVVLESLRRNSV